MRISLKKNHFQQLYIHALPSGLHAMELHFHLDGWTSLCPIRRTAVHLEVFYNMANSCLLGFICESFIVHVVDSNRGRMVCLVPGCIATAFLTFSLDLALNRKQLSSPCILLTRHQSASGDEWRFLNPYAIGYSGVKFSWQEFTLET